MGDGLGGAVVEVTGVDDGGVRRKQMVVDGTITRGLVAPKPICPSAHKGDLPRT
jgi:hypothetical protein